MGFVVQAYGKRCPFVLDFIIDLARRAGAASWFASSRAPIGMPRSSARSWTASTTSRLYPQDLHRRLLHRLRRKLLAATDAVFPQFATHNAQTLATIYQLAGSDFEVGKYEFQCLHGMGEPLYDEVVGTHNLDRPCRIYAPVGTHETLLAYLVRRLLENGANSSFVNRIADPNVSVDELVADPVDIVASDACRSAPPHEQIALPSRSLRSAPANSAGSDLSNENVACGADRGAQALRATIAWAAAANRS